ncbi:MAG: lipase/esterase [Solirubrobacterales bacterium]|nr:lipase/esterase [Solirubrobacterales bacterium]
MAPDPARPASTARAALDLARGGAVTRYGDHPDQVCELRLPPAPGPHPVAILLHGGSWGGRWTRHTVRPLAGALTRLGMATWNVEYRRVDRGGGWPQTLQDVGDGIDALAEADAPLDLTRAVLVGHSAGGQLALFASARDRLPAGFPAADPVVKATALVALAPVLSLFPAARGLLGATRAQAPERWRYADPSTMLPIGLPSLVVHGTADRLLPAAASARYVTQARHHGDDIELVTVDGLGHSAVIDPRGAAWPPVAGWLRERGLAGPAQSPEAAATSATVPPSSNSSHASATLPSGSVQ